MDRIDLPMFTLLRPTVEPLSLREIGEVGPATDAEGEITPWGLFSIHGGAGDDYFDKEVYDKAKALNIFPVLDGVTEEGIPYYPLALDEVDMFVGDRWSTADILDAAINRGLIVAKLPDTMDSIHYRWYVCVPPSDIERLARCSEKQQNSNLQERP